MPSNSKPLIGYADGTLHMEKVALAAIAEQVDTPFYAYSRGMIEKRYGDYQAAFEGLHPRILTCYAVKANPNQAVLTILRQAGAGADLTTGGELERALAAGFEPQKIVFSGIGKRRQDIARALKAGIRQINVESVAEMARIDALAAEMGVKAPIALRLNPQLDSLSRPDQAQITTGRPDSKFGIPWPLVETMLPSLAKDYPHLDIVGVSIHIGSNFQAAEFSQLERVFTTLRDHYLPRLAAHDVTVRTLDIGGGVGVDDENPFQIDNPLIKDYGALVKRIFTPLLQSLPDLTLITEPGRSLVAESGLLVTK